MPTRDPAATRWTLINVIGDPRADEADVARAMEELSARYRPVVRSLVTKFARDYRVELDVEDVTQDFFYKVVIGRELFARAKAERGRFRSLLFTSVSRFVLDERDRGKRDRAQARLDDEEFPELVDPASHDQLDELIREWGRSLVAQAVEHLEAECQEELADNFLLFKARFLSGEHDFPSWRDVGKTLGVDEKQARTLAETAMRRFRRILRDMVENDPGSSGDVDRDLQELMSKL